MDHFSQGPFILESQKDKLHKSKPKCYSTLLRGQDRTRNLCGVTLAYATEAV